MSKRMMRAMREATTYVRGERVDRTPRPGRTYPPGRVCAAPTCRTRLSIYNPERFCWSHARPDAFTEPGIGRASKAA